ncbi:conserved protein of unknown function [Rhodovastum atsumiense]|uniref:Virulence factor SrfB n=1 Tax=Rhodovastum atsumiense TaxID=504468 RepID=A0A5M6INH0_9PROT|nr:virulence factor SrfB [Rhodovastum atsumiense]KAA5609459.1 hypothetical protein F1189_24140 [Rhodovastum atsumiense]CAH2603541.1 conserved protein of unknown function [Rhodovastum atsumiense]
MIRPAAELPPLNADVTVPLVPNSGVQFLDIPLALDLRLGRDWFEAPAGEGIGALKPLRREDDLYAYTDAAGQTFYVRPDDEGFIGLDGAAALRPFLGKWVPLPLLQIHTDDVPGRRRLEAGPENWARLRIVELDRPEPGGLRHRAVLAIDTRCEPRGDGTPFLAPWAEVPARFAVGTRPEELAWLLDREWMGTWLAEMYRERDVNGDSHEPDARIGCRHYAAYLTLLALLEASRALPVIRLLDLAAAEKQNAVIDVDLVLDIGNSRSCGFLVERVPGRPAGLAESYRRLVLRDLTACEETADRPFESRVEFAPAGFGRDELSLAAGSPNAFDWPSPVRIGPEAVRLSALNPGNLGQTGISSPKRYLWDDRPAMSPWRSNQSGGSDGAIRGGYLKFLSEDGSVKSLRNRPGIALRPMFSRASLYTLFLLEVLLHARAQVNSYAARYGRQYLDAPRRLARLILTLPAAMPLEEVRCVEERARAAAYLFGDVTGQPAAGTPGQRPRAPIEVEARLDEATATQIVYLYDQINHAYRDAPAYFELVGRARPRPPARATAADAPASPAPDGAGPLPSLRIASIDVGGGTTDLAIYTYFLDDRVVVPHETFREGFRLAGDDVLETVVMRHVLPAVRHALAEAGLGAARAEQFLLATFRVPPANEPERQARRLVLNHVLVPAALALLGEYEGWNPMAGGGTATRCIGEMIAPVAAGLQAVRPPGTRAEPPGARAADWFERRARDAGAGGFRLAEVALPLDFPALHATVRQTLRNALDPLLELVNRFDCDVLLLSGRAARWPALTDMVVASLAIEPNRVQPMHRYRVGAWYPYADPLGRIEDPKTTVAVGAMICRLLQGGQLDNLALVDVFRVRSTARFVGLMDGERIREERLLFTDIDVDALPADAEPLLRTLSFSGRSFLGFKQFRAARWPASPLYRIEFASPEAASGMSLPLRLQVQSRVREEGDSGRAGPVAPVRRWMEFAIQPRGIVQANGNPVREGSVAQALQTARNDEGSHWLDTGCLETLDAVLSAVAERR